MEGLQGTVVIVDDSVVTTSQLVPFFHGRLGLDVVAIGTDGVQAIELYRKHRPDIITLDVTMPNMDGYQATKQIMSEFPDATILIISSIRGDTILKCLEAGAKAYIEKPFRLNDTEKMAGVSELIRKLLSTKTSDSVSDPGE